MIRRILFPNYKLEENPNDLNKYAVTRSLDGQPVVAQLSKSDTLGTPVFFVCDTRQEAANVVRLMEAANISKERAVQLITASMDKQANAIIDQYIHTSNQIKELMQ